jgi:hypothetical protein
MKSDYSGIRAVNYSTLKHLRKPDGSPARYKYFLDHPVPETTAMLLGRAVHTAVLEPERFALEYAVWDGYRRGKEYTLFAARAMEEGRTVLNATEYETCESVADSVRSHPDAAVILSGGEAEKTLCWTNEDTGIECKGRVDWLTSGLIADLKTTHDISARNFARHSWQMGTFFQMAMYQDGLNVMTGETATIAIIAAEQKPPYLCCVYWLDDASLAAAYEEYVSCLEQLKHCREFNNWPGPESGELSAPSWILAEHEMEPLTFGGEEMEI